MLYFFVQAEDGIRDLVRSRGLGDVYKRQVVNQYIYLDITPPDGEGESTFWANDNEYINALWTCLLYTSDAADERSSVDLGGRRIIKKKNRWRRCCNK